MATTLDVTATLKEGRELDAIGYGLDSAAILRERKLNQENALKASLACTEAQMSFTPLVFSVDGMEGKEAKAARKRLASRLVEKWDRPYSHVCRFLRARLSVALVKPRLQRTFR